MAIKTLTDFEFISAVKWLCLRLYMSVHSVFLAFTACFIYFHFISYKLDGNGLVFFSFFFLGKTNVPIGRVFHQSD